MRSLRLMSSLTSVPRHVVNGLFTRLISTGATSVAPNADAKRAGDISNAFVSLSGVLKDAEPLDDRYRILKEELLGRDSATRQKWKDAWDNLLHIIQAKAKVVAEKGSDYIPTLNFADIEGTESDWHNSENEHLKTFSRQYKERGVAVIRNVVPRDEALALKLDLQQYITRNADRVKGFPTDNKQVFEIYWSKAQVIARAHPRMRLASQFLLSFWHEGQATHGVNSAAILPVAYADRLRIRLPGDTSFALGPHVDGGSVERWEKNGYGLANSGKGTYSDVWSGTWQDHDPWNWQRRIGAVSDMYQGTGACSVFRAAQGWLAMSRIAPGEGHLMVNPMLKEALAYWLMRPFFEPAESQEDAVTDWLHARNWDLEEPCSAKVHGATPGFGQEINKILHPHLRLDETMIHMPTVEPGDYVVWHCDTIHAVDATHSGEQDSSVLYIPVCPWTVDNLKFAQRQLKAFSSGVPCPDFGGGEGERHFQGRLGMKDLESLLDQEGLWTTGVADDISSSNSADDAERLFGHVLGLAKDTNTLDAKRAADS